MSHLCAYLVSQAHQYPGENVMVSDCALLPPAGRDEKFITIHLFALHSLAAPWLPPPSLSTPWLSRGCPLAAPSLALQSLAAPSLALHSLTVPWLPPPSLSTPWLSHGCPLLGSPLSGWPVAGAAGGLGQVCKRLFDRLIAL